MKKSIVFFFLIVSILLVGCANKEAHKQYLESFDNAANQYYETAKKPLLKLTLPSPKDNDPYEIVIHQEPERMIPQQIKDSEWTGPVTAGLGILGGAINTGLSSHYRSEDIKHLSGRRSGGITSGGGDITIKDSYHESSTVSNGSATTNQGRSREDEVVFQPPETEEPLPIE